MESQSSTQLTSSSIALLASLEPTRLRDVLLSGGTPLQRQQLLYAWSKWARPKQLPPVGDWQTWLVLAGRGFGKTRTGAEWIRADAEAHPRYRIALVAPTAADARDVIVEGESGILAISPPWFMPLYEPSKRRLTWPNGTMATLFSADEPRQLRGPQFHRAWCDELCHWRFAEETWDMLQFGLRLGERPQCVITTTPKPIRLLKMLLERPHTHVTRGSTYENQANLAEGFFEDIIGRYEGTRIGRQELNAEILEDQEGALWKRQLLEDLRVTRIPELVRIVVAIDPAATSSESSNETGIIVAGLGRDKQGYVLEDRTLRGSPAEWARQAVAAYYSHNADRIVAETNQGGEMVRQTISTIDPKAAYKGVHASRGKQTRAEPVAALYEQGRVHHVGSFPELEDQLCQWVPGEASPDRLDAMVWALTELMLNEEKSRKLITF